MQLGLTNFDTDPKNQRARELQIIQGIDPEMFIKQYDPENADEILATENKAPEQTITGQNVGEYKQGGNNAQERMKTASNEISTIADQLGLEQKKKIQDEASRIRRNAKMAKYGDVFSLLAQSIGAFSGASVPQIDNRTDATRSAEYLRRLNEQAMNEDSRTNMLKLQEKIRALNTLESYNRQDQQYERQSKDLETRMDKQAAKEREMLELRNNYENDPNSTRNKRDAEKMEIERNELERRGRIADKDMEYRDSQIEYMKAGTRSRDAYAAIKVIEAGGGSPKDAYLTLYGTDKTKPASYIKTEGQALDVFNSILENLNLQGSDLTALRTKKGNGESISSTDVKAVISKYWKSVMPAEGETEVSDEQKRADYSIPESLDPENEDNLPGVQRLNMYANGVFTKYKDQPELIIEKLTKFLMKEHSLTEQQAKDFITNTYM